jgi:hypothetical protein
MDWMIGVLGFDSLQGLGMFFFTIMFRTALGPTQSPIQLVPGAVSLRVKWLGREADHSPPSSAEVKNAWSYTPLPQYIFMAWCLVKHRDSFTFYIYVIMKLVQRLDCSLDSWGSIPDKSNAGIISFLCHVPTGSGVYPAFCLGIGVLSLMVQQLGHEGDNLPSTCAKVKNACGAISLLPQFILMWCLAKHRDSFTSTITIVKSPFNVPL